MNDIITHWLEFWKKEGIRFLGFGTPHIPDLEERCFHAFSEGYKQGRKDSAWDFDLPEDAYVTAFEFGEEVE